MLFGYSEQFVSAPFLLFSGVKSGKLAFFVEIRYCFFMYAPAEVSGRVQFLNRAQGLDEPRQVTGPVDHRNQGSDGDADQAEFQDEGDCGHEVKNGFDNRLSAPLKNH